MAGANLVGLVPGLTSPTGDLSTTVALALVVFAAVHWFGIRIEGFRAQLRHYLHPNPILLPFHVLGEITRTLALAIRLFGNIMSLEMAALLLLLVAGFLVPVPLLVLHIIEALVQAYIFGMLALVYVAGSLQAQRDRKKDWTMDKITWFALLSTGGALAKIAIGVIFPSLAMGRAIAQALDAPAHELDGEPTLHRLLPLTPPSAPRFAYPPQLQLPPTGFFATSSGARWPATARSRMPSWCSARWTSRPACASASGSRHSPMPNTCATRSAARCSF